MLTACAAIWTQSLHQQLVSGGNSSVRDIVSSAMTFFASSYASQMGFASGPPIHDFLCVAYLLDPTLFATPEGKEARRLRVEVQTTDGYNLGASIVAFHDQWPIEHEGWQAGGRNVRVLEHLDVSQAVLPALYVD